MMAEPLPSLSDELTLAEQLEYRARQMKHIADLVEDARQRGDDLSWVPEAAVRMMQGVAAEMATWSTELEP